MLSKSLEIVESLTVDNIVTDEFLREVKNHKTLLIQMYHAAVRRVNGERAVCQYLQQHPITHPFHTVAIGKAACAMSRGVLVDAEHFVSGLVITDEKYRDDDLDSRFEICFGSHPLPTEKSLQAGTRVVQFLQSLPASESVLFLVSGGASSMVEQLVDGFALADLYELNKCLLASGFDIHEMNRIRKRISRIKGGGLLNFVNCHSIQALYISDVFGDDVSVIGSGLLVPPGSVVADLPPGLPDWFYKKVASKSIPVSKAHVDVKHELVATLSDARQAAAQFATDAGFEVFLQSNFISGDAFSIGQQLGDFLNQAKPGVYVWGGESTVRLPPTPGKGGRCQVLALGVATELDCTQEVAFLAAGTDGQDGVSPFAGAYVDTSTCARVQRLGLNLDEVLRAANSALIFSELGDGIDSCYTGTNVMDLLIGLKR